MSSSTTLSQFYDNITSKDIFNTLNHAKTCDPFSPTIVPPAMNFPDKHMISNMEEEFRKQTLTPNFQLMRSMSCVTTASSKSNTLSIGNDSVFSSNIFDNGNDRPRDRAFSESDRNQRNQNSNRYKTELCRPYEENGKCKYGDKCQFAHGGHELRNLQRHPKYKTEMCRTYHTVGICPYGPRCHFIHNPNERTWGISPPKQRKDKTAERPKLLQFSSSAPLGSTGDLTPPRSGCDSPSPFSPLSNVESGDHLLAALTAQARELATSDHHTDLILSSRGMSPTIPSPMGSVPESPFYCGPQSAGFNLEVHHNHIKDNVFFPTLVHSKPPSPVGYRPPSPPDSDPESYCDRSTSPSSSVGSMRSARLPIFRVMSMEEYR